MGFFDKLKEQASSLGQQLDSALDGTGQKSQINALRKQRDGMISQLGESLLNQFREEEVDVEALRPQVDQIFENERQLIELEKQMEAQRQAAAQAKAQQAQVPQAPGAPAPPPPGGAQAAPPPPPPGAQQSAPAPPAAPQEAGAISCPSCGSEVPADSAFCPDCGTKTGG